MKKIFLWSVFILLSLSFTACNDSDPASPSGVLQSTTWKTEGIYTNGTQVNINVPNLAVKFNSTTINFNGTTAPVVWSLNGAGTQMTLIYPNGFGGGNLSVGTQTLETEITSNSLKFINSTGSDISLFGGLITLSPNAELRLIPQSADPSEPTNTTNTVLTNGTWTANDMAEEGGLFTISGMTETRATTPTFNMKFSTIFGINTLSINGIPSFLWSVDNAANPTQLTINYPTPKSGVSSITLDMELRDSNTKLVFSKDTQVSIFADIITINADQELRLVQE